MAKPQFFKTITGKSLHLPVFFPDATRAVLKSLDSTDIESTFANNSAKVKIVQTNIVTRVTIQFRGPVEERFENLKSLYKEICHQDIKSSDTD